MTVPEIDVAALAELPGDRVLIDVREPDEFAEGHVPGAVLIPLGDLVERFDDVPEDGTVYVICQVGGRSARAVEYLLSQGLDAVNVAGGTTAWLQAGEPVDTGEAAS